MHALPGSLALTAGQVLACFAVGSGEALGPACGPWSAWQKEENGDELFAAAQTQIPHRGIDKAEV
jgi:hypothetical protein